MSDHKLSNAQKRAFKEGLNRFLTVLLTFAMVMQTSPVAYAGNLVAQAEEKAAVEEAAVKAQAEEAEAKVDETKSEPVAEAKKAEEPAAEEKKAEPAAEESKTEETAAEDKKAEEAKAEDKKSEPAAEDKKSEETKAETSATEEHSAEPAEEPDTKTVYEYDDDAVHVTATLDDPAAVPDEAVFQVTPVNEYSDQYSYGAYMQALNDAAGAEDAYTAENTLLYDAAFLMTDENGETFEVQPTSPVRLHFEFKQGQVSENLKAEVLDDLQVLHLPVNSDVRAKTTYETTGIGASDVVVQNIASDDLAVFGTDSFEIKVNSFSVFAVSYQHEDEPEPEAVPVEDEQAEPAEGEESVDTPEAAAESEAQVEGEAQDEEAKTDESAATRKTYEFENGIVRVVATVDDPAAVPDNAELRVLPVLAGSSKYDFDGYMAELNAGENKYNADNTLLFDVSFVVRGEDGTLTEVEPAEGAVKVQFTFLRGQLERQLEAPAAADIEVTHLPNAGGAEKLATDASGATIEVTTESFSVFAFSYTVDFAYNGFMYRLPGEGQVLLSQLFAALGIEADAAKATNVEFTNYDLLAVEQVAGDWQLTSLQSFETPEVLTVTMASGAVHEIEVTDPADGSVDIGGALESVEVKVNGQLVSADQALNLINGQTYDIHIGFRETDSCQFSDDENEMLYKLPAGITFAQTGKQYFSIDEGTFGSLDGNEYWVGDDGYLHVKFNTVDTQHFRLLKSDDAAFMSFDIQGTFNADGSSINWGEDIKTDVTLTDKHDASVSKTGYYDAGDKKIHYTVTVSSEGTSTDVKIQDQINGTALTSDVSSISDLVIKKNGQNVTDTSGFSMSNTSNKGFTLEMPDMADGDVYTVEYTASVDLDALGKSGKTTVEAADNGVKLTTHDEPTPEESHSYEFDINYSGMSKTATDVSDAYEEGEGENKKKYRDVTWTVDANSERNIAIDHITDTVRADSQNRMVMGGAGVTVVVKRNGRADETRTLAWGEDGANGKLTKSGDGWSWTYVPPSSDGKAEYVVTYTTKVDITDLTKSVTVNNDVEDGPGEVGQGTGIGPDGIVGLVKNATSVTPEEVEWAIDVSIPKTGTSSTRVIDKLPNHGDGANPANEGVYYDDFKSYSVTGLIEGEERSVLTYGYQSWLNQWNAGEKYETTQKTPRSEGDTLVEVYITFQHKDGDTWVDGLKNTNEERNIRVVVTTTNDSDWVDAAYKDYWNYKDHKNKATFGEIEAEKTVEVGKPKITKSYPEQQPSSPVTYKDGSTHKVYLYYLTLQGVNSQANQVTDTFDTDVFELLDINNIDPTSIQYSNPFADCGQIDCMSNATSFEKANSTNATITPTSTGATIATTQLDKQKSGSYYSNYRIRYYLVMKDEAKAAEKALAAGGKATFTNTAVWGDVDSHVDVEYGHPIVDKEANKPYDGAHGRQVDYTVTINPDKILLNNGNDMTLEDVFSGNMSIDYNSIKITTDPSNKTVTYDYYGTKGVYKVPDQTKVVIKYTCYVTGEGDLRLSNKATLDGKYSDETSQWETITSEGRGGAKIVAVRLKKYEGGNQAVNLAGAKFMLLDSELNPVNYTDKMSSNSENYSKIGTPIIFETTSDGDLIITLNRHDDGVNLKQGTVYYLEEVEAPTGMALDTTLYSFVISTDLSDAEYTREDGVYVYYAGDIMKVRNTPEQEQMVVTKRFGGNVKLTQAQKEKISFKVEEVNEQGEPIADGFVKEFTYAQMTYNKYTLNNDTVSDNNPDKHFGAGYYKVTELHADTASMRSDDLGEEKLDSNVTATTFYTVTSNGTTASSTPAATGASVPTGATQVAEDKTTNVIFTNNYNTGTYHLTKIDGGTDQPIAGVKFSVFNAADTNQEHPVTTYTTKSDGVINITRAGEEESHLDEGVLYYVVETEPAEGYKMPDNPQKYYFYFGETAPEGAAEHNAIRLADGSVYEEIYNATDTSIMVQKKWLNSDGSEMSTDDIKDKTATVTLKRTKSVVQSCEITINYSQDTNSYTKSFTVPKGEETQIKFLGQWTNPLTINGEEYPFTDGKDILYTIPSTQTSNGSVSITVEGSNYIGNEGEMSKITLATEFSDEDWVYDDPEEDTTFTKVVGTDDDGKTVQVSTTQELNYSNNFMFTWENLEKVDADGNKYLYYIYEAPLNDFETTIVPPASEAVDSGTIVVTNKSEEATGGLKVTKTVTGDIPGKATKAFKFTVKNAAADQWLDENGEFSDSAVEISITDGGEYAVPATKLPAGSVWTVTELGTGEGGDAQVDGWSLVASGSGDVTVVKDQQVEKALTNAYTQDFGGLKVTKKVLKGADDTKFTFTIALTAPTGVTLADSYKYTITKSDGQTQGTITPSALASTGIELADGETFEIQGLPVGTTWTVNENNVPTGFEFVDYTVDATTGLAQATGTIATKDSTVAITANNTHPSGGTQLEVKKAIANGTWPKTETGAAAEAVFELTAVSGKKADDTAIAAANVPMPAEAGREVKLTQANVAGAFGTIPFTLADAGNTYTYKISETSDWSTYAKGAAAWAKSADITATVVVSNNGDGTIKADVSYDTTSKGVITNTYTPDQPKFDKKIKDVNDSTGDASDWQDSADYDIGDAVPYKLTATLAQDVTSYKKYHVTFHDQMEDTLSFNAITSVKVGNTTIQPKSDTNPGGYVLVGEQGDQTFDVTLTWEGTDGATISDTSLNGATVTVEFTATLGDNANLGKPGNVNAAQLKFSNNPTSTDDSDEGTTPWDYVIAFTYKVSVDKLNQAGDDLNGATFKLEKVIKGAANADLGTITGTDASTFAWTGLDDGTYILTEVEAPAGYAKIAPITFVVDATHGPEWKYTSETENAAFSPATPARTSILTQLTGTEAEGNAKTGLLTLTADNDKGTLSGDIKNTELGALKIKKIVKVNGGDPKTTDDFRAVDGTYTFMVVKEGVTPIKVEITFAQGKAASAKVNDKDATVDNDGYVTVSDLAYGTYTVTESEPTNGMTIFGDAAKTVTVDKGKSATIPTVEFTNVKPGTPVFEKKIKDTNDSTGVTSGWQDSADYDIGDSVPFLLKATTSADVTSYKKYHLTFTDTMEPGLTFEGITSVKVNGNDVTNYKLDKIDNQNFKVTLTWEGVNGATIADSSLNNATVEVEFTSILNEDAVLGNEGNVNAAKLNYSNNPNSVDDSDKDSKDTPWDYVIAFTYKVDVSKVDENGDALEGATFKLEKKLANGTLKDVALNVNANTFTATGLDDGDYVLTETTTPTGFKAIDPIEFTVDATHGVTWSYSADWKGNPIKDATGREGILTDLTGDVTKGDLELAPADDLSGLTGDIENIELGKLVIKKNVTVNGKAATTDEDKAIVDGTYNFQVKKQSGEVVGTASITIKDGVSNTATVENLPADTYDVVELDNANGLTVLGGNLQKVTVKEGATANATPAQVEFTNTKPGTPDFEKKIADTNDSDPKLVLPTDLSTLDTLDKDRWQDSADYDMGDSVPFKLTATLAHDASSYKHYYVSFGDKMEDGLTFEKVQKVTVNGVAVSEYGFSNANSQEFSVRLDWGEGQRLPITEDLNDAVVDVYFTAKLNTSAKIGAEGNVNAAQLTFANNPNSVDGGSNTTPWDYVIAFTYKVDVNKVDENSAALEGATFKLQKKLANGTLKDVALNVKANTFTATGLDDGDYVLTETAAPKGYKLIDPIEFTVTAEHTVVWNYNSDEFAPSPRGRNALLTSLTADDGKAATDTGKITFTPDLANGALAGDVTNEKHDKPGFEKKIKDTNDSTGETSGWQDSADYDINDAVPFLLKATLPADIENYKHYHITFTDEMEKSLTFAEIKSVKVAGTEVTDYEFKQSGDQKFELTLKWGEGEPTAITEALAGAEVTVEFTATLNSQAKLGSVGNVNGAKLTYSNNSTSDGEEDTEDTPWDYVIVFTYKVDVNKVDENGAALDGAEFKLEKKLVDKTLKPVALTVEGNVFTGTGLDDGTYILTETKAPTGFALADPIEFEVTADHEIVWADTTHAGVAPAYGDAMPAGRAALLTDLTGKVTSGELKLEADEAAGALTGGVTNIKFGKLYITKNVKNDGTAGSLDGTYAFQVKNEKGTVVAEPTIEIKDGAATGTTTVENLPEGTYTVSEVIPEGAEYVLLTDNDVQVEVKNGVNAEVKTAEFTNSKPGTPDFEKKIYDINDSELVMPEDISTIDAEAWDDSADHDMGDAVPFKLTAKLPHDVTDYKHYHITFTDQMEKGLTFGEVTKVTVNGASGVDYTVTETDDQNFAVTLEWGEAEGKELAPITDTLNGAQIDVYFTATLNEDAVIGNQGNVNKAKLTFSSNPKVDTETKDTEWDYVIAFTYKVDVSKLDQNATALAGAEFMLEKWDAKTKTYVEVGRQTTTAGTTFSWKGVDDGTYRLTETKTPEGYVTAAPMEFKVVAGHTEAWEQAETDRTAVMTSLNGELVSGEITLAADAAAGTVAGNVVNYDKATATFEVTKAINDWADIKGFDFELAAVTEGAPMPVDADGKVVTTATATKDAPLATFGTASYDKVGTYEYTISEVLPDGVDAEHPTLNGITYDTEAHKVTVTVSRNEDGTYSASVAYDEGAESLTITNKYFGVTAKPEFSKLYFGTGEHTFTFTVAAASDDQGTLREGTAIEYATKDNTFVNAPVVDNGTNAFSFEVTTNSANFIDNEAVVTLPEITYHEAGTYYYAITENPYEGILTDESVLVATVKVAWDEEAEKATSEISYQLFWDGLPIDSASSDVREIINNGDITIEFDDNTHKELYGRHGITYFMPEVRKVMENGTLAGGEFKFTLTDEAGKELETASNDALGKVAFSALKFDKDDIDKTFTFYIREVPGSNATIKYDESTVKLTVEVTKGEDNLITCTGTYAQSNEAAEYVNTEDPTFVNAYDTIRVHTIKRTRTADGSLGEVVAGAKYGMWMVNPNGEDVYMGLGRDRAEADGSEQYCSAADGSLWFDLPAEPGVAYYFLEEGPAPAGHLVDPYRTDYFTLVKSGEGDNVTFSLAYEGSDAVSAALASGEAASN